MTATDTVVREGQALVQRYRLLRRLTDGGGIRRDLRGDPPEPDLVAEMLRQLAPGVDAPLTSRNAIWPIPAGVRLETLYASPWLAGHLASTDCYTVPRSAAAFAALFEARTGISPDCEAMDRNFRITPRQLGRVFEEACGAAERPSQAGLLLLARHFDEAAGAAPLMGQRRRDWRFRGPLISGFRLFAELERAALIVQDLGRLNLLSVADIRHWLDDEDVRPLASALSSYPHLRRLFDYQMIGTDALGAFDNADRGGYAPLASDLRAGAAARGRLDVDIVAALTREGELARIALRAAFPDGMAGKRASSLVNDEPATFYGLNWTLAGAFAADLGRAFQHGDVASATGAEHERQALLADTIVAGLDPVLHRRQAGRTAGLGTSPMSKQPSGTNRQRDALAHGRLVLPARDLLGSAARANADLWTDRFGDAPLWRSLLTRQLGNLPLDLDEDERATIAGAFERLEALFDATLAGGCDADDVQGRQDAVHAACDLATAVSAISLNRAVGSAIQAWLSAYDVEKDCLVIGKRHGARLNAGVAHVTRVRKKKGVPSAGVLAKGMPRNRRGRTKKKQALMRTVDD